MGSPTYPKRPPFFAYRFCRLMAKVCLANELGPEGCWLLTVIAQTEDAGGYRKPVTYWNGQLVPLAGCGSESGLRRLREKCVRAGWLAYVPGRKGVAPRYWVTVPDHAADLPDGPSDERPGKYVAAMPATGEQESGEKAVGKRWESEQESGEKAVGKRWESEQHSSLTLTHSLPQDTPPTPAGGECDPPGVEIITPPRFEEVRAAWNGIGGGVVPAEHVAPKHRTMFAARGRSRLFCDRWRDGIEAVRRSSRCNGLVTDWRADLGWFLKDGTLEELLNGNYRDGSPTPKATGPPARTARQQADAAADEYLREQERKATEGG
jgi:hypothetical protein